MLHTLEHPIKLAWYGEICDVEFLRLIEGIYAIGVTKATGIDFNTAFLLKTARKPNSADHDLHEKLKTVSAPFRMYAANWDLYCSQMLLQRHGLLVPSTSDIKLAFKELYGYPAKDANVHAICRLVRMRRFDLQLGYYTANFWQLMEVAACLDYLGTERKASSVSVIFNKIYKRTPSDAEISAVKGIDFTKTGKEIRNEIEQLIKVCDTDRGKEPTDRPGRFGWRGIRR